MFHVESLFAYQVNIGEPTYLLPYHVLKYITHWTKLYKQPKVILISFSWWPAFYSNLHFTCTLYSV